MLIYNILHLQRRISPIFRFSLLNYNANQVA